MPPRVGVERSHSVKKPYDADGPTAPVALTALTGTPIGEREGGFGLGTSESTFPGCPERAARSGINACSSPLWL